MMIRFFLPLLYSLAYSSIPPQRILRHHRRADKLRPGGPAPSTASRIPTPAAPSGAAALVRRGAAIAVSPTTHQRRHDAGALALPHVVRVDHAAGALVGGPSAPVPSSNQKHGGTVDGRATDDAHRNADAAGADVVVVLVARERSPGVVVVLVAVVAAGLGVGVGDAGAVEGEAAEQRDGGVDVRHQRADAGVVVVVELRAARVQRQVQRIHQVRVDVRFGHRRDVTRLLGVVVGGQVGHDHVLTVDVEAVCDA